MKPNYTEMAKETIANFIEKAGKPQEFHAIVAVMQLINELVETALVWLGLLVILVVIFWADCVRFAVDAELRGFAAEVRKANISLPEKERLLDLTEDLQDRIEGKNSISALKWFKHRSAIREMLADGIVGDEVPLIERELKRVANAFLEARP